MIEDFDDNLVKKCWNENAKVWTQLTDNGCDICRDLFNSPMFFELLPDIKGKKGLDIGCGNGYQTRKLADLGAEMTGIDICEAFLETAVDRERANSKGINYINCNAVNTPFPDGTFGFATAIMSLMDMTDPVAAIKEAFRVIKPGGFLQFNICHPNTDMSYRRVAFDQNYNVIGLTIGGYYNAKPAIDEWMFGGASEETRQILPVFKIPCIRLTLSQWVNCLIETGFVIEKMGEPYPSPEIVEKYPQLKAAALMPFFLHIRSRKPQ